MIQVLLILLAPLAMADDDCSYLQRVTEAELGLHHCRSPLVRFLDLAEAHDKGLRAIHTEMETSFRAFSPKPGLSVPDATASAKSALTWATDALKNVPAFTSKHDALLAEFVAAAEDDLAKLRARDRELRQPPLRGDLNGLPKEAAAAAQAIRAQNKEADAQRVRERERLISTQDQYQDAIKMAKERQETWRRRHECYLSAIAFLKKRLRELDAAKLASLTEVEVFVRASLPMEAPRPACY